MSPYGALLVPQAVALDVDVQGKIALLRAAAQMLGQSCRIDVALIFRALHRREQAGLTGIGEGLAIPHARVPGIDRPVTLFVRPRVPIRFDAPGAKPVSELLVMLVPLGGAPEAQLQLLRTVAEPFSDPAFRAALAAAADAAAVTAVFECWGGQPDREIEALPRAG